METILEIIFICMTSANEWHEWNLILPSLSFIHKAHVHSSIHSSLPFYLLLRKPKPFTIYIHIYILGHLFFFRPKPHLLPIIVKPNQLGCVFINEPRITPELNHIVWDKLRFVAGGQRCKRKWAMWGIWERKNCACAYYCWSKLFSGSELC